MKTIVLTGGGTAGHVTPNLALLPSLYAEGWRVIYVGSTGGMEQGLAEAAGLEYHGVSTGKLRRYLSKENISDAFKVLKGLSEAKALLKKLKPDLVFSKGGFVSVPVVMAAKKLGIPVVSHESDMTPGLANRLTLSAVKVVCTSFPETAAQLGGKGVYTGSPIRKELFAGSREEGLRLSGLSGEKPVLMMMGGSSGAQKVNALLREALPALLSTFDVIHLCGKGNVDESLHMLAGYSQFAYANEELPHLFAAADLMLSRAGSNAINELLALRKPALLVPLPAAGASRGDQVLNAESFEKQGFSMVVQQADLTAEKLTEALLALYSNRAAYAAAMEASPAQDGVSAVMAQLRKAMPE